MKKMISFWLVVALVGMFLAGCGKETKTVYVQAPADQTGAKLAITGKNTQELQLFSNKDGSIRFLDNGSILVFPEDVEKVVFSSYRMGVDQYSPIAGSIDATGLVKFSGPPNNGDGEYRLIFKDPAVDPVTVILERNVATYKPMKFWVSDSGWFSYGEQVETTAMMRIEGENMVLDFDFGCDMLPGLKPYATFSEGMTVEFITTGGRSFSVLIQEDEIGNLSAIGMTIPLTVLTDSQWGQRTVGGKFYVVSPGGMKYQMNFSYDENALYQWYLWSYADNFYVSYLPESGEVRIHQNFTPTMD